MSKLVKQSQLRDITVDLWSKAKDNYKVSFKEAQYNDVTKKITFTSIEGATKEVEITDLTNLQTNLDAKVDVADTTAVGGAGNANKVVKLDASGKLDTTMIPDLAITSVHSVNDESDALVLIDNKTVEVGDVVIVTSKNNGVYMCKSTTGNNTFEDRFLELSMGDGTIKKVNGEVANGNGEVTLNATHIEMSTGGTIENEIKKKVETINGHSTVNGNIEFSLELATDNLNLKVDNNIVSSIPVMTDAEVLEIKNLFV